MSEPLACAAAGVALGLLGAGLLHLDPVARTLDAAILRKPQTVGSPAFAGWFGPIGAAALFYVMLMQDETGSASLAPPISLAIGASVMAHGITSTPLTRRFGRGRPGKVDQDGPNGQGNAGEPGG